MRFGDRYRIVEMLGRGATGEVYRADDLKLGQQVALKFLPPHLAENEDARARIRNEVRVARQVSHPNVCRVHDIAEADGYVFISMEYVDGEDLRSVLRRLGRPSREKVAEIARQLCAGLAAAHEIGVLHRDLKSANVMIDGRGRARIADFGLASFQHELPEDTVAGTPAYMAPELLAGAPPPRGPTSTRWASSSSSWPRAGRRSRARPSASCAASSSPACRPPRASTSLTSTRSSSA